jgi:hypothetical protein
MGVPMVKDVLQNTHERKNVLYPTLYNFSSAYGIIRPGQNEQYMINYSRMFLYGGNWSRYGPFYDPSSFDVHYNIQYGEAIWIYSLEEQNVRITDWGAGTAIYHDITQ